MQLHGQLVVGLLDFPLQVRCEYLSHALRRECSCCFVAEAIEMIPEKHLSQHLTTAYCKNTYVQMDGTAQRISLMLFGYLIQSLVLGHVGRSTDTQCRTSRKSCAEIVKDDRASSTWHRIDVHCVRSNASLANYLHTQSIAKNG